MTPNGTAIRALREAQSLSIRQLARLTGLDRGYLSRLERGLAGARTDTVHRIAQALGVPPADLEKGDNVSTDVLEQVVPAPGTPEGAYFHYSPEQAEQWLPYSASQLRKKAHARQIPHRGGGQGHRITFLGLDIREISDSLAVRPIGEYASAPKVPAAA